MSPSPALWGAVVRHGDRHPIPPGRGSPWRPWIASVRLSFEEYRFRRNPRNRVPVPVKNPSYPSILYILLVSTIRGIGEIADPAPDGAPWFAMMMTEGDPRRRSEAPVVAAPPHTEIASPTKPSIRARGRRERTGPPAAQHETAGELTGSLPTKHACELTQYERSTPVSSASASSVYPIETSIFAPGSCRVTRRVADLLATWASLQRPHRRAACFCRRFR